mmetsp:Transcript_59888/g.139530  ORF Transcript_59888/g.139530 Transcript_59888/m.139530 type:complete len:249 (-) Transcript_59888:121-867(-)
MFGCGDGEACTRLSIVLLQHHERCHRVCAQEVHKMRRATRGCGLHGGDTAKPEVVQLEEVQPLVDGLLAARVLQVLGDDLLLLTALRADRCRVPDLHQKRFQVVGEPIALWVCVFQSEEHVLVWEDRALRNRLDHYGKLPAVCFQDVLPGLAVEEFLIVTPHRVRKVYPEVGLRFVDLLCSHNWPNKVLLDEVLQAEEAHLLKRTTTALEVGIHHFSAGGILQVVGHLVGISEEEEVVELVSVWAAAT